MSLLERFEKQLAARGLTVVPAGPGYPPGTLLLKGPKEAQTPEVLAAVKKFKPEFLKKLAPPAVAAAPIQPTGGPPAGE